MKRLRTIDGPKLRRTSKKSRIGESMSNGGFVYVKLLGAWALLVMADYLLGFRFEYLWPFWLLMRSIIDSFRYQGLAFSVFFVCVTVTSDLVCFLFIPVQLLFFLASTYAWVQYVWHADRGVCLPTVSLWLLFIYFEASVRLKDLQKAPGTFPFTMDLCRPFAAHCIGYPVVTLGFGIKSYLGGWRLQRRQREVFKFNEMYSRLLTEALPGIWYGPGTKLPSNEPDHLSLVDYPTERTDEERISNSGSLPTVRTKLPSTSIKTSADNAKAAWLNWPSSLWPSSSSIFAVDTNRPPGPTPSSSRHCSDDDDDECSIDGRKKRPSTRSATRPVRHSAPTVKEHSAVSAVNSCHPVVPVVASSGNASNVSSTAAVGYQHSNGEVVRGHQEDRQTVICLELELEKVRSELRSSRSQESELRVQLNQLISSGKSTKNDLQTSRQKNEQLDIKLQKLLTAREQDKTVMQTLERKLVECQKVKLELDKELDRERRHKQKEEAAVARALAHANKSECGETCKQRRRELDSEGKQLRRELRSKEEQLAHLDVELQSLRQYKETHSAEILMSALATMREKNAHLEQSLSAENRLKQDLFRALGDAKCQVEGIQHQLRNKDRELEEIRHKMLTFVAKDVDQQQSTAGLTPSPPAPMVNGQQGNMELLTNALAAAAYMQ